MTTNTSGSVTKIKIGNNLYDIGVEGQALSGVRSDGPGNVVSNIEYNTTTNELIAKKPTDFATAEELSIFSNVINHIQDKNNDMSNTLLNINNRVTDLENNKDSVYIGQSAPDSDIHNIWINTSDSEQVSNYALAARNNNNGTTETVDTVETLVVNENNESIVVYEVQKDTTEEPEVINIGDSGENIEL